MSKISGWNFSQHITSADNFKQKSEVLNTWRVGMNNFAHDELLELIRTSK
ncbi:hypothetical protein LIZ10_10575, partial [Escherichia coli]|nr:hypothetical protein [Escherichia coli]